MDTKVSNKVLLIGFNDAKSLMAQLGLTRGRICFWMESLHPICYEKEKNTLLINNLIFNIFLIKKEN